MPQDQRGDTEDQPNVEATLMDDWFKKPNKPSTPDRLWNDGKSIDSRPPCTPTFNLLKGTCKSFVELEYYFEECYKAVTDQLDWNNPEGHEYPFYLSKPLSLIEAQGCQVVPADYFFNIDLKYLIGKLSNLEQDVIFDLNVALRMFTKRIVILKRVEDLQLGVKSYQKKLNITKPETFRSDIPKLTPYTAYKNPQGIICQNKFKRNRMDYLPKRRWSNLDRKRSCVMIKAIDQQLLERRLMRNLE
nr:hypothetical protein [Tanacetum cinerariifolium]